MFTTPNARFFGAIAVLTIGFVAMQEIIGGNAGLWFAFAFATWWLLNQNLGHLLAKPFEWATNLLEE